MTNLNEKFCAYCGKSYINTYINNYGDEYSKDTVCCSKSCAGKLSKTIDKDVLEKKALDYIREQNGYCTSVEICTGINHSSKTFTKHGLKVSDLNTELGFIKPSSRFQEKVGEFLSKKFTNIEYEKQFDGLVGNTGHPLRVDFYIPEINIVIEADGTQHSDPNHQWSEFKNGTVQEYDKIKDDYFKEQGIKVCRIPYKRNLKESDILSHLN
jgi:very-short-patch-repair endonuclease